MAAVDVQATPTEVLGLPDYVLDPNACLKDKVGSWRYGRAPDYTKTRQVWAQSTFFPITSSTHGIFFFLLFDLPHLHHCLRWLDFQVGKFLC